jgi:hypothetical protein
MDETLVAFGSALKALGGGKIGGLLIRYSDADSPDLEGEFFTKSTDFGLELPAKVGVYYNHGMDKELGKKRMGRAELKATDEGIWFEAQLDLSDRYQAKVYELAEMERLGASSGAAPHLVEKKAAGKATEILSWPVAEASLTVTPAEWRNTVTALKSVTLPSLEEAAKCYGCGMAYASEHRENIPAEATMAALERMNSALFYGTVSQTIRDDKTPLADRVAVLRKAFDDNRDLALRVIEAILQGTGDEDAAKALASIKALWGPNDPTQAGVGLTLASHSEAVVSAVEGYADRLESRHEARIKAGRMFSEANVTELREVQDSLAALQSRLTTLLEKAAPKQSADTPQDQAVTGEEATKTPSASLRLETLRLQSQALQQRFAGVIQ